MSRTPATSMRITPPAISIARGVPHLETIRKLMLELLCCGTDPPHQKQNRSIYRNIRRQTITPTHAERTPATRNGNCVLNLRNTKLNIHPGCPKCFPEMHSCASTYQKPSPQIPGTPATSMPVPGTGRIPVPGPNFDTQNSTSTQAIAHAERSPDWKQQVGCVNGVIYIR